MKTIGQTSANHSARGPAHIEGRTFDAGFSKPPRREGLFTETPLTTRGKALGVLAAGAVVAGAALLLPNQAPNPEHATKAEISANIDQLKSITEVNGAEQTLPVGAKAYASPDTASTVRLTTGQGKLEGKTLVLKYAGIVGGDNNSDHIWEAFEAPASVVDAPDDASTTKGQAERMVYVPIDSIDNLPHEVTDVYYMAGKDGTGGFGIQSGVNSDGTARGGDQTIHALQAHIIPVQ